MTTPEIQITTPPLTDPSANLLIVGDGHVSETPSSTELALPLSIQDLLTPNLETTQIGLVMNRWNLKGWARPEIIENAIEQGVNPTALSVVLDKIDSQPLAARVINQMATMGLTPSQAIETLLQAETRNYGQAAIVNEILMVSDAIDRKNTGEKDLLPTRWKEKERRALEFLSLTPEQREQSSLTHNALLESWNEYRDNRGKDYQNRPQWGISFTGVVRLYALMQDPEQVAALLRTIVETTVIHRSTVKSDQKKYAYITERLSLAAVEGEEIDVIAEIHEWCEAYIDRHKFSDRRPWDD